MALTNSAIAELLAVAADDFEERRRKACRSAARVALGWPEEAAAIVADGRSLTELPRVGPWLAQLIGGWLEDPPPQPEPSPLRADFMALSEAMSVLRDMPGLGDGVKGDLQMHSSYSDGAASVEEMAEQAASLGHEYIAITDHSKGLRIAGGMDESTLARQGVEIDRLNERMTARGSGIRVLRSIEVNLDTSGDVDMDPRSLDTLEIVIGSFHSKLRVIDDQTERYVAALRNPAINILGHPRGRIYNFRLGLKADWAKVFDVAAQLGKAVEINCYPDRQDLNRDLLRAANSSGCRFSLGTDSHAPWELLNIRLGLAAAAEVGIPKERIVNFLPVEELLEWARATRP